MEIWKDIKDYEGKYQVSNQGRVRSLDRINSAGKRTSGRIRIPTKNKNGYLYVNLCSNGKPHNCSVHRLVAVAFLPNPDNKYTVNHKNENKEDNRVDNLEWMSLEENLRYGTHDKRAAQTKKGMMCGPDHPNFGKYGINANTHKGKVVGIGKRNPNDTVMFDTAADAARILHLSAGQLCDSIHNCRKSCGGYYWRRIDG